MKTQIKFRNCSLEVFVMQKTYFTEKLVHVSILDIRTRFQYHIGPYILIHRIWGTF